MHGVRAMAHEDHVRVLHWLPDEDRWEVIPWNDWIAFCELGATFRTIPSVGGGIHYFIVLIHDDDLPINLIPHKYLIDLDGRIGRDNFGDLTRQEREDYDRLMIARELGPRDEERLDEIRKKLGNVQLPPEESLDALKRTLGREPKGDSAAAWVLRKFERNS
jgi:hypothetical protein